MKRQMPGEGLTNGGFSRTNGSSVTLIAEALQDFSPTPRTFPLASKNDEKFLIDELLRRPRPDLMIKIIGENYDFARNSFQSSIDRAFRYVMREIMEETNIWLWNGSRGIVDLVNCSEPAIDYPYGYVDSITSESFGKSQLLIYSARFSPRIENIVQCIEQHERFRGVPIVNLFLKGDNTSVKQIIDSINRNQPVIIIKGSGPIANHLAVFFEKEPITLSTETTGKVIKPERLADIDYHQLQQLSDREQSFISICQPGRDEFDSAIIRAIAKRLKNSPQARIDELWFAIQWKKLNYTEIHLLNDHTIIEWTNEELDTCLEIAIQCNAVPFVELLFEYGASLQRLAMVTKPNIFMKDFEEETRGIGVIIKSLPTVNYSDPEIRMRVYVHNLFRWAVENQHFDLLMNVCTRLEDSVIGILLIHQWCKYKEDKDSTSRNVYRKYRQQFDIYAADILDLYYADDEKNTIAWLNEKSNFYQDQIAADLIDDLTPKQLIASQCMQSYANSRWYGEQFHPDKNFLWEILIFVVCLCPLLLFIPLVQNRIFDRQVIEERRRMGEKQSKCGSKIFRPLHLFYQDNVVIRFRCSMVSYTAFLVLFSYTMLFDYFPLNIYGERRSSIEGLPIPITEMIVHLFLASIGLQEMRQIYLHVKSIFIKSFYWEELSDSKLHSHSVFSFYRDDPWNVLDFIAFTLWLVGISTRFIVRDVAFEVSKICLSLDLCLWYMRCLHVFLASERLGARLLMIFHTMKDLILFLLFIFIFFCAYTFTTYSLISTSSFVVWSNATHFTTVQNGGDTSNFDIFRNIIEWGVWKIFGSTSLTTTDLLDINYSAKNDAYGFVTLILTITFLIIAYVLLLNNLIALFNFTIQHVHTESHRAWCNHFYGILTEYEEKDLFVPPLNLLLFPLSYFIRRKDDQRKRWTTFQGKTNEEKQRIRRRQQYIAEQYWKNKRRQENDSPIPRIFVCRQCRSRAVESDFVESTVL